MPTDAARLQLARLKLIQEAGTDRKVQSKVLRDRYPSVRQGGACSQIHSRPDRGANRKDGNVFPRMVRGRACRITAVVRSENQQIVQFQVGSETFRSLS